MDNLQSTIPTGRRSTVNLVRSSNPWTEADSAAGFVLRYFSPMRRMLVQIVGSQQLADDALKLLLAHLVSSGFGDHKQGLLRDFVLKGVLSAAKKSVAGLPGDNQPTGKLNDKNAQGRDWLVLWREGLLERAWRALERYEHAQAGEPLHTILMETTGSKAVSLETVLNRLNENTDHPITVGKGQEMLAKAKVIFAQFVADEVAETLATPTPEDVKREIATLGLGKAFQGIAVHST